MLARFTELARDAVAVALMSLATVPSALSTRLLELLDDEENPAARTARHRLAEHSRLLGLRPRDVRRWPWPQSPKKVVGQLTFFRKLVAEFKTPHTTVWEFQ